MNALRRVELAIAAIAVTLLVLTSLAIILLRLFASTAWSVGTVDTLSQYPSHLMVIAALLGGSLALTRGDQLKIEVLNGILSEQNRERAHRIVSAFACAVFAVFIALIVRYLTVDYRAIVAFGYLPLMFIIWLKLFWLSLGRK